MACRAPIASGTCRSLSAGVIWLTFIWFISFGYSVPAAAIPNFSDTCPYGILHLVFPYAAEEFPESWVACGLFLDGLDHSLSMGRKQVFKRASRKLLND